MKHLLFFAAMLATLAAPAQSTVIKDRPVFYSANQVGLLEGPAGSAFLAQTVNGVQCKGWSAGLGVGIDKYRERSISAFLQVRRSILKKQPLFLYADVGANILWPLAAEVEWQNWQNRKNKPGIYLDGGVQYQWKIRQRQAVLFSLGYSEKRYSWQTSVPSFCIDGTCPDQKNSWYYTFRRIAVKVGWKF